MNHVAADYAYVSVQSCVVLAGDVGACFRRSKYRWKDLTRAPSTFCWWTSCRWTTAATSTTTPSGWRRARRSLTCLVDSTFTRTHQPAERTGWSSHCPSTNSNSPTTISTRTDTYVYIHICASQCQLTCHSLSQSDTHHKSKYISK